MHLLILKAHDIITEVKGYTLGSKAKGQLNSVEARVIKAFGNDCKTNLQLKSSLYMVTIRSKRANDRYQRSSYFQLLQLVYA